MRALWREIREEFKTVAAGKTLDAIFPPLVFVAVNAFARLEIALGAAGLLGLLIVFKRWRARQSWMYALGGLLGVLVASGFAFLAQNAANFFLPGIVSTAVLLLFAIVSLIAGRPMAAWVSHLSRGWTLTWFWRPDVRPAYREVTIGWALFFLIRLVAQIVLFMEGDPVRLAFYNTLLGFPLLFVGLVFTYVYGLWRLRRLGGPGIDEYDRGSEPPYRGQTRGF